MIKEIDYNKDINFIKLLNTDKLYIYSIFIYFNSYKNKLNILFNLMDMLNDSSIYLNNDLYNLLEFIIIIINHIYETSNRNNKKLIYNKIKNSNLINLCITYKNSSKLLIIIDNYKLLNKYNKTFILNCIIQTSRYGNFKDLKFWIKKYEGFEKNNSISVLIEKYPIILINSTLNNSFKVFKYIFKTNYYINISNNILKKILYNIVKKESTIIKFLKFISIYYDISGFIIYLYNNIKSNDIIIKIQKNHCFTITHCIKSLESVYHRIINNSDNNTELYLYINKIYKYLSTEDMIISHIILNIKHNINTTNLIKNISNYSFVINKDNELLLDYLLSYPLIKLCSDDIIIKKCSDILFKNNILEKIIRHKLNIIDNFYFLYTRFFFINNNNICISANKILHNIRMYVNRFKKKIKTQKCYNFLYNLTHYNKIQLYNNSNKLLLMEPPNKLLNIYKLPITIYPIYIEYTVKYEYFEKYNLYLIYDIDIPKMNLLDRLIYLRNIHPYIDTTIDIYDGNHNNYKDIIKKDNENIFKYLNTIDDNINKWYPKLFIIL